PWPRRTHAPSTRWDALGRAARRWYCRPMRPAAWSCALALVVSCYSPEPQPGAPCTPGAERCPSGQTCELVAGTHVCVTEPGPDAAPARPWTLVQTRASMSQERISI